MNPTQKQSVEPRSIQKAVSYQWQKSAIGVLSFLALLLLFGCATTEDAKRRTEGELRAYKNFLLLESPSPNGFRTRYVMILRHSDVESMRKDVNMSYDQQAKVVAGLLFPLSKGPASSKELNTSAMEISKRATVRRFATVSQLSLSTHVPPGWDEPVAAVFWEQ